AEERHAAMRNPTERLHLEPIDSAMAKADAVDVERLRDDDEVGAVAMHVAFLSEICHAGESAALFVDRAALLDAAMQAHSLASNGFDGINRGDDSGLLVGRASPIDFAVAEATPV